MSPDGGTATIRLRRDVIFHDGSPLTAAVVQGLIQKQLPQISELARADIVDVRVASPSEVEFRLRRRSNFLVESLGFAIHAPGGMQVWTGPFQTAAERADELELRANERYHGGKPLIDRILLKSYPSVRAAWAELLRGDVDMLYEAGIDALDSLESSNATKVFAFQRPYTFMVLLNATKPPLDSRLFRERLNSAIDRTQLLDEVLDGHGSPATGPVSPLHWAFDPALPHFQFDPGSGSSQGTGASPFTILMVEPSHERMALALQRQLQSAGMAVRLQQVSADDYQRRLESRDFDAILVDAVHGPTMVRPALWWHTRGPLNYGGYSSAAVDAALESINRAPDDAAYRAGVAAFQRAIVNDPPAIFLAWSERARAVSTRFEVPVEPGRDILSTLRLWRPVGQPALPAKAVN